MIGRLQGILIEKQAPALLLDVSGVAYEVEAPLSTFYKLPALGQNLSLWIHMVVREDAQLLYGFFDREERTLFRTLIKVNGVGPKMALGLLSGIEPDAFVRCIEHGDVSTLTKVPGVGKKTAERLVIEMRDRLKELSPVAVVKGETARLKLNVEASATEEAESALVALGYKSADAQKAINAVKNEHETAEELLRAALKRMVK